jgi:predicted phage baseplate assembly protein
MASSYTTFPPIGVDLAFFVKDAPGEGRVSHCGVPATRAYASARLMWEGFDGTDWQRLDALNDDTLAFTRSGHIVVRVPSNVALQRAYLGEYDAIDPDTQQPRDPLFWFRARLIRSQYERPPRLAAVRINTVRALQAQTVENEVLGGTSGVRDQTFQIENTPIVKGSLKITIDEGTSDGPREWTIVDDLFGSDGSAEHLAVNWSSGEVRAGNGENGQVPVANPNNPDTNVIATTYRFGGGARGNVAAGALTTLLTPIDGIDPGSVTNVFAASGGRDEESLREAKVRARKALRARERAVTPEDFELLAQLAGNVRRAKALPLAHPQFPGVRVPGAVTIIVVPDSAAPNPQPSDGLLRTVCEYLDARRLLTTELFVVGPRYVRVSVRATIVARDNANTAQVRQAVETELSRYLHPLTGGDDASGWPFGGTIRHSKVMQRTFVEGVDSVRDLVLIVDDEPQPECRDVPLEAANALVYNTTHQIDVVTAREVEEVA